MWICGQYQFVQFFFFFFFQGNLEFCTLLVLDVMICGKFPSVKPIQFFQKTGSSLGLWTICNEIIIVKCLLSFGIEVIVWRHKKTKKKPPFRTIERLNKWKRWSKPTDAMYGNSDPIKQILNNCGGILYLLFLWLSRFLPNDNNKFSSFT